MCSKPQGSRQGKFSERPTLSLFCKQVHLVSAICTTQLHCRLHFGLGPQKGSKGGGQKNKTSLFRSFISEPLVSSGAGRGRERDSPNKRTQGDARKGRSLKKSNCKSKKARRKRRRVFGAGHTSWGNPFLEQPNSCPRQRINSFLSLEGGGLTNPGRDKLFAQSTFAVGLSALAFEAQT